MKKEIILAAYINIGNLPNDVVDEYMTNLKLGDKLKLDSEQLKVHWVFIPVRNETTRVECIYPSYVIADGNVVIDELVNLNNILKSTSENLFDKSK